MKGMRSGARRWTRGPLVLAGLALAALVAPPGPDGIVTAAAQEAKPRPVEELLKDLESKAGKVREKAALELGGHGPAAAKAVPNLLKALGDAYEPVRLAAAASLSKIDPKERAGLPLLLKSVASGKQGVPPEAVTALASYGASTPGVVDALVAAMEGKALRPAAMQAFLVMGEEAVPLLVAAMEPEEPPHAEWILTAGIALGLPGAPVCLEFLDHPDNGLRTRATECLATGLRDRYPDPVGSILGVLEKPTVSAGSLKQATEEAVEAGAAVVPGLAGLLASSPSSAVQKQVAEVLGAMGPAAKGAARALRFAGTAFDPGLQKAALAALTSVDPAGSVPPRKAASSAYSGIFRGRTDLFVKNLARDGRGVEGCVDAALEWLARHQGRTGMWEASTFENTCIQNKCGGVGLSGFDPALTGLSLLAFLARGQTHRTQPHGELVRKGIGALLAQQDAEGCLCTRGGSGHFVFAHAMAALAVVEAYGMTGSPDLHRRAQDAANFVMQCRNPYQAWRYGVRPQDNDTAVTGWMVLLLKVAAEAGLDVDPDAFEGAKTWLDKVTEPEYGRAGYTARGNGPSVYEAGGSGHADRFPADKTEGLTAQAIFTRMLCGATKDDDWVSKGADLIVLEPPLWDETAGTIDFHYWHFGALAMFQVGGERWKSWSESLKTALVKTQRLDKSDDRYGSWDTTDRWSWAGGRIYATAINCLTLETYWRYPRLLEKKKGGRRRRPNRPRRPAPNRPAPGTGRP